MHKCLSAHAQHKSKYIFKIWLNQKFIFLMLLIILLLHYFNAIDCQLKLIYIHFLRFHLHLIIAAFTSKLYERKFTFPHQITHLAFLTVRLWAKEWLLYNTKKWSKLLQPCLKRTVSCGDQKQRKAQRRGKKQINKGFKHKPGYEKKRKHCAVFGRAIAKGVG